MSLYHEDLASRIDGEKVIVTSPGVKKPRGISYGTGGIGFAPNLYNKALLPMTPFIYFDNAVVTSETWPDEKLKVAGETIDPATVGKIYEYRKMPLLSVQFRDHAVLQADKPVTIWGSTRNYGEWQPGPEEGDCKVHFEFGDIKKTIDVTPENDAPTGTADSYTTAEDSPLTVAASGEVTDARIVSDTVKSSGLQGCILAQIRELDPALPVVVMTAWATVDVAIAMDLPQQVTEVAPRLRWVQGVGAGVGQLASAEGVLRQFADPFELPLRAQVVEGFHADSGPPSP